VFAGVDHRMTISREEIFGPVLSILPYDNEDTAIAQANDTPYGLAAYVQGEPGHARAVARRLRAGVVYLNEPAADMSAPFGGYKQSGNGREYGEWGLEAYLEVKGVVGWGP
jgi:aldehyde dehydrogenase (NAD+)